MADYFLHTFNAAHVGDSDIISVLKYPVSWARSLAAEFALKREEIEARRNDPSLSDEEISLIDKDLALLDDEYDFSDRSKLISRATLDRITVDSFTRANNEKKTSSALAASI